MNFFFREGLLFVFLAEEKDFARAEDDEAIGFEFVGGLSEVQVFDDVPSRGSGIAIQDCQVESMVGVPLFES
jgi:hypothetical protein